MKPTTQVILSSICISMLIPFALYWIDATFVMDVPVFSGLLYPYIGLPVICFATGIYFGFKDKVCWYYPLLLFLLYIPNLFLVFNSSALFHCFMAAVPALIGLTIGSLIKHKKGVQQ